MINCRKQSKKFKKSIPIIPISSVVNEEKVQELKTQNDQLQSTILSQKRCLEEMEETKDENINQLLMQKEDIMHSTIKIKEQMVRTILLIIQHSIFSIHVIYKIKFLFFRAEI